MGTSNIFHGTINYTYIETGYNEQDFNKVYDTKPISKDCTLKLPNEINDYTIEMVFMLPDGKHNNLIECSLKDNSHYTNDELTLNFNFKDYIIDIDKVIFLGEFVIELKDENDGFHFFKFSIEVDNKEIITKIKNIV